MTLKFENTMFYALLLVPMVCSFMAKKIFHHIQHFDSSSHTQNVEEEMKIF